MRKKFILLILLFVVQDIQAQKRSVFDTVWALYRADNQQTEQVAAGAKASGFDGIAFVMTPTFHLPNGVLWGNVDGEGAEFVSQGASGRLDRVTDAWIDNRKNQIDIITSRGLKVDLVLLWIEELANALTNTGNANNIIGQYCAKLKSKGVFNKPGIRAIILGGDYQPKPRPNVESDFIPGWIQCRSHIPSSLPVGYHNGHAQAISMLADNPGVADFIALQTGHTNLSPQFRIREAQDAGLDVWWYESIYPGIDIRRNGTCATFSETRQATENARELVSNMTYGRNERWQMSSAVYDGTFEAGRNYDPFGCFSGVEAIQSYSSYRQEDTQIISLWKGDDTGGGETDDAVASGRGFDVFKVGSNVYEMRSKGNNAGDWAQIRDMSVNGFPRVTDNSQDGRPTLRTKPIENGHRIRFILINDNGQSTCSNGCDYVEITHNTGGTENSSRIVKVVIHRADGTTETVTGN